MGTSHSKPQAKRLAAPTTTFYNVPFDATPPSQLEVPPNEKSTFAWQNLSTSPITLPQGPPAQTQYYSKSIDKGQQGSTVAAYNTYGGNSGIFLDAFLGGLYMSGYTSMIQFAPDKMAVLPMQAQTEWTGDKADFDWSLVAAGMGVYKQPTNPASAVAGGSSGNQYYVSTIVAVDPYTGQHKHSYTPGVNMLRYTLPFASSSIDLHSCSLNIAGMVYHPTFGLMAYGPVIEVTGTTDTVQTAKLNPFKLDPGAGKVVIARPDTTNTQNYNAFVPDMAGVAFGNVAQTTSWILTPSCDWDMKNLPGYQALIDKVKQSDLGSGMSDDDIIKNMCQYKLSDFMQGATIVLSNGTMMVESFPELGTVSNASPLSYGLVSCGYTANSTFSGIGIPTGNDKFALFVNLYYYYDESLFPDAWPDAMAPKPVTSGWMMPRNVTGVCPAAPSSAAFVAGTSKVIDCPSPPVSLTNPPVGAAPYPVTQNQGIQGLNPCLCLGCSKLGEGDSPQYPCVHLKNMGVGADGLACLVIPSNDQNKLMLGQPFQQAGTYPDDPQHVAFTRSICGPKGTLNAAMPMIDPEFGSTLSGTQGISNITNLNKNQGGQFITWFDTTDRSALPIAMHVVGSTIFIVAMGVGAADMTPYLYKLQLVDANKSPPVRTSLIGPMTMVQTLSITPLNNLIKTYSRPGTSFANAVIASIAETNIVDFGASATGFPVMTLLVTLAQGTNTTTNASYPAVGPVDEGINNPFKATQAIITLGLNLTDGNDPSVLDIDLLNANNAQNTRAAPNATQAPLARGLTRTNLSVPSFAVVSEATNNGLDSTYCTLNAGTCDAMVTGDPMQKALYIDSIAPPTEAGQGPVLTASEQPVQLAWDKGTNAAMLSHIKVYTPVKLSKQVFNFTTIQQYANQPCVLSVQADSTRDGGNVWMWTRVGDTGDGNQRWLVQGNKIVLESNQNFALGLNGNTLCLRPLAQASTFSIQPSTKVGDQGLQAYTLQINNQYVNVTSSQPSDMPYILRWSGAPDEFSCIVTTTGTVGTNIVLGNFEHYPVSPNKVWMLNGNKLLSQANQGNGIGRCSDTTQLCLTSAGDAIVWENVSAGNNVILKTGDEFLSIEGSPSPPPPGTGKRVALRAPVSALTWCMLTADKTDLAENAMLVMFNTQNNPENKLSVWLQQPDNSFLLEEDPSWAIGIDQDRNVACLVPAAQAIKWTIETSDAGKTLGYNGMFIYPNWTQCVDPNSGYSCDGQGCSVVYGSHEDSPFAWQYSFVIAELGPPSAVGARASLGDATNCIGAKLVLTTDISKAMQFNFDPQDSQGFSCNGSQLTLGSYDQLNSNFLQVLIDSSMSMSGSSVLGPTNPLSLPTQSLVFPELPHMRPDSIGNNAGAVQELAQRAAPNTQTVPAAELVASFDLQGSQLVGWTQGLADRFRSQFRGQAIRPNLYGPVVQVVSFVPQSALASAKTDPDLKSALGGVFSLSSHRGVLSSQQVLGYVLSWMTTSQDGSNYKAFKSKPLDNTYEGTTILQQSQITPVYGPLMSVAPNSIVHLPQLGAPDGSQNRWLLGAQYPVRGVAAPNARAYNYELDRAITTVNTNYRDPNDWGLLNFKYVQTQHDPAFGQTPLFQMQYTDNQLQQGGVKVWLPRPVHPISGLTTCTMADNAADTGDYAGLKWISQYMSTEPSVAPNTEFGKAGMVGHRSMFGLQPGHLNLVGPGAYYLGNDQQMIKNVSQSGFGLQSMPNINGAYLSTLLPSAASASCQ